MAPVNRQMFRESCGRRLHPHRLYYVELMDLEPGMKVLDLGCGAGEVLMHCALERGIEGWGIDYSNAAIQLAEELKKLLPLDIQTRVQFHLGDCTELGIFPDGFFDRALSFSSIEHLYDWQIERMLAKSTGCFVMMVYSLSNPTPIGMLSVWPGHWHGGYFICWLAMN